MGVSVRNELRKLILEHARQKSFDVSIPLDRVNQLIAHPTTGPQQWRMKTGDGDQSDRAMLDALVLIEHLRYLLDITPKNEWYIFGELNRDNLIEQISTKLYVVKTPVPNRDIGVCFLEILKLTITSGSHFPHYNLHPYFRHFFTPQCHDVFCLYLDTMGVGQSPLIGSTGESLSGYVEQIIAVAEAIDIFFLELMNEFKSATLNKLVRNFEFKARKNCAKFKELFACLHDNVNHVGVVIKVKLNFHLVKYGVNNLDEVQENADVFAKAIDSLSAKIKKTKGLRGFVRLVSVLNAPKNKPWYIECYFLLVYPKNGYQFNYTNGSAAIWAESDEVTWSTIKTMLGNARSENYQSLAKELNKITKNGKNIKTVISLVCKAKDKKSKECLEGENGERGNITNDKIMKEFRRNQIIFDSMAFLKNVKRFWHESLKTVLDLNAEILSCYEVNLEGMSFLEGPSSDDVIFKPKGVIPNCKRYSGKQKMPSNYKLEFDSMFLEIIETSMTPMYFKTLSLHGSTKGSLDEVRIINAKGIKEMFPVSKTGI